VVGIASPCCLCHSRPARVPFCSAFTCLVHGADLFQRSGLEACAVQVLWATPAVSCRRCCCCSAFTGRSIIFLSAAPLSTFCIYCGRYDGEPRRPGISILAWPANILQTFRGGLILGTAAAKTEGFVQLATAFVRTPRVTNGVAATAMAYLIARLLAKILLREAWREQYNGMYVGCVLPERQRGWRVTGDIRRRLHPFSR